MSEPTGRAPAAEVSETIGNTPMAVLGRVGASPTGPRSWQSSST